MLCNYHNKQAAAVCNVCGRGLCSTCASLFSPPTCVDCARERIADTKKQMTVSIILTVVLMILGIIVGKSIWGVLLAGIPSGWRLLNKITPRIFLWMPLVGWLIYFAVKFLLSYAIGIIALPIQFVRDIKALQDVKRLDSYAQGLNL